MGAGWVGVGAALAKSCTEHLLKLNPSHLNPDGVGGWIKWGVWIRGGGGYGFEGGGCAIVSDLALRSCHQQHDARTLVAGERRHGFPSVLDILAINLKATPTGWMRLAAGCREAGETHASVKSPSKYPNHQPREGFFFKNSEKRKALIVSGLMELLSSPPCPAADIHLAAQLTGQ